MKVFYLGDHRTTSVTIVSANIVNLTKRAFPTLAE